MKKAVYIFILIIGFFASCKDGTSECNELRQQDSIRIASSYNRFMEDLKLENADLKDSLSRISCIKIMSEKDSLLKLTDSLSTKLFQQTYRVNRVKYYLDIVDRNRTQEKFLRGWVRRAVEE